MAPQNLSKIEHFVVVMLENRSFDNLLGFLYADQNNVSPTGQSFAGLTGQESNPDSSGNQINVFQLKKGGKNSYFYPRADPGEGFANTNVQLFGINPPDAGAEATNQGFVKNFQTNMTMTKAHALPGTQASDVMAIYPPAMTPVLSGLAQGYAVCDYWFSSAPTETFPNRAFVAMATSQGRLGDSSSSFTAPSIYSLLGKHNLTWAMYGYTQLPLARLSIADISHAPTSNFGKFADFKTAIASGSLANYVFLEPEWGQAGNSQHPNYDVSKGEQFLHDVYYALYGSKVWNSTLLIVLYDEHGGCYDHVPPPTNAVTPDNSVGEEGFDFKRFGVRVPAVLISPWIEAGTVYRAPGWEHGSPPTPATPFDHTSILKTVEERFDLPNLTARDAAAPGIGDVLTLGAARTDDPLNGKAKPRSQPKPKGVKWAPSHLDLSLAEMVSHVPITDETGDIRDAEMPPLKTADDAIDFANKRSKAVHKSRQRFEKRHGGAR
jgi:phospholipase C